jgi:hypothetical protein
VSKLLIPPTRSQYINFTPVPNPTEAESKLSLYYDPPYYIVRRLELVSIAKEQNEECKEITQQQQSSPLYSFIYALKSSEARRQYPMRLKTVIDYLKLSATLEEQAIEYLNKAETQENGAQWAQQSIMAFHESIKRESGVKNLPWVLLRTTIELPNYFVK